jgi:SAM-dependent methyltransferase
LGSYGRSVAQRGHGRRTARRVASVESRTFVRSGTMNRDRVTEVYEGAAGSRTQSRTLRERVHWMCSQAQGEEVLDVGCSQGIASLLLAREGRRVVGVDRELEALEFARSRLLAEEAAVQERTRFILGEAGALPFEDASFDTVLLGEVLEHQVQVRPPLDEALRVLRPGGRLVITVPFGEHEHQDHKEPLYLGGLLDILATGYAIDTIVLIDRYAGIAGTADSASTAIGESLWRDALRAAEGRLRAQDDLVERQRDELREIRGDVRQLYGHGQGVDTLRAEIKGLEARLADHEQHRAQLETLFERLSKDAERWSARAATLEERDQRWRERDARHKRRIGELEERLALRAQQLADIHATRWYRFARFTWRLRRRILHPFGGGDGSGSASAGGGGAASANGAGAAGTAGAVTRDGASANGASEAEARDRLTPRN